MTMNLHVGVLHYDPSFEPFPLLTDPVDYEPNTLNVREDKPMLHYWLNVLSDSIQTIMAKAVASEGGTAGGSNLPFPPIPPTTLSSKDVPPCLFQLLACLLTNLSMLAL